VSYSSEKSGVTEASVTKALEPFNLKGVRDVQRRILDQVPSRGFMPSKELEKGIGEAEDDACVSTPIRWAYAEEAFSINEFDKKMPSRRTAFFKLRVCIVISVHLPGVVSWLVHLHRQLLSGQLQYPRH
jgi:hypothetical protein